MKVDKRGYKLPGHLPGHRAIAFDLASRAEGISAPELSDHLRCCGSKAGTMLWQMETIQGRIFSGRVMGHTKRYFADAAHRDAWVSKTEAKVAQPKPLPPKKPPADWVSAPVWVPKPVKVRETIWPKHVKVQVIPSPAEFGPAAKVRCAPDERIVGGFASAGIGRYL